MMFTWIFVLAVIILAVWYFSKEKGNLSFGNNKKDAAKDILNRRFANGEITEQEYEERKAVLEEDEY